MLLGREVPAADRELDAAGLYVLPGGIDVHTHLGRLRPFQGVDDFRTGTRAAAAGGVTTICEYVIHPRDTSLASQVEQWLAQGREQSIVDFGLHLHIGDPRPEVLNEMPALVEAGYTSFKVFMNRNFDSRVREYLTALERAGALGALTCIHCEDESIIGHLTDNLLGQGKTDVRYFAQSRPAFSEAVATARAVAFAEATGAPVYIVHLSSAAALEVTRRARARGLPVYVETRPIYLYLTRERFDQPGKEGNKYVGYPPLRDSEDVSALWDGLRNGDIQTVATDHVGLSFAPKAEPPDFSRIPAGMSNLETLVPLLYSEGVAKGRISLPRFVELIATNPARLFGMFPRKGTIAIGSDADLVLFDPSVQVTIQAEQMHSQADYDVYEGFTVQGWPKVVLSRGQVIFQDGRVVGRPGQGQFIPRERFGGL